MKLTEKLRRVGEAKKKSTSDMQKKEADGAFMDFETIHSGLKSLVEKGDFKNAIKRISTLKSTIESYESEYNLYKELKKEGK